ncbi:hypothetical protein TKK_0011445 [Trichogramma kaykai]
MQSAQSHGPLYCPLQRAMKRVMAFAVLPAKHRRIPYSIPSDWKALWYSNLDELQRVNEANENNTVTNVTVQLGGTAFLHCKVRNLAERTVSDAEISWIRRRDWHVLTSSMFTYTNDERFQVLHPEGSDDWTLQIKYVQERDNGTYECQSFGSGNNTVYGITVSRVVQSLPASSRSIYPRLDEFLKLEYVSENLNRTI